MNNTSSKRPWNATDAVKAITLEWANQNMETDFHINGLEGPNKWREMYELPKLIYSSDKGKIIEDL